MGTQPVRVLLVDEQSWPRRGLAAMLGDETDVRVVGEASDQVSARTLADRVRPDVVVLDAPAARLAGAVRALATDPTRVLVFTAHTGDADVVAALRAGASGVLGKDATPAEVVAAIRAVAAGGAVLAPGPLRRLLDRALLVLPDESPTVAPVAGQGLTDREREVWIQVARGLTNAEIAVTLGVTDATVKTHVGNILSKLGLRDRVQAVIAAYEAGVIRPGGAP